MHKAAYSLLLSPQAPAPADAGRRWAPLGASSAQPTCARLATALPTTQRISGASMAFPSSYSGMLTRLASACDLAGFWPLGRGSLVHRRSSPGRQRSSSAIDRATTRGRRGRLFSSVACAEQGASDPHPPDRFRQTPKALAPFGIFPNIQGGIIGAWSTRLSASNVLSNAA